MLKDGMHFSPWQGLKIACHCSCWCTLSFVEEDAVQLLSQITDLFFVMKFWENFGRFLIVAD